MLCVESVEERSLSRNLALVDHVADAAELHEVEKHLEDLQLVALPPRVHGLDLSNLQASND